MTWKDIVAESLCELGGEATLVELTEKVGSHPARPHTATWRATLRRVVRQYVLFEPFRTSQGRAAYRLVEPPSSAEMVIERDDLHGEQQGMLLKLGQVCGYETFTNATDRRIRRIGESSIAQYATVRNDPGSIRGLPLDKIRTIDVMWLNEDNDGLYPRYAFEVENSTKVKNGLLRLLKIPYRYQTELYIIGKGEEEERLFNKYISDSPFREHQRRFRFRTFKSVRSFYDSALVFEKRRRGLGVDFREL